MTGHPDANNYGRIAASEGLGTALLMLGGPGVAILGDGSPTVVAISAGLTLAVLVYVLGPISGAHVNPAVTLSMWLAKTIDLRWAVTAWISQFAGAIAGGAVILGLARGRLGFIRGNFYSNGFNRSAAPFSFARLGTVAVAEILFTAVLVMVYLFAAKRRFAPSMVGVVTGAALSVGWLATMALDGGSLNPARSLGTAVYAVLERDALAQVWAFVVFPAIGAIAGVVAWLVLDDARLEDTLLAQVPGADEIRDALD